MTVNEQKTRTGIDRVRHATAYSIEGLKSAYAHESAFRLEFRFAVVMLPAAFVVGRGWLQIGVLAGSVVLVLVVELLNSAIESLTDRVSLERHELSKRAKDQGSAAVFLAALLCAGLWLAALWQRFGS